MATPASSTTTTWLPAPGTHFLQHHFDIPPSLPTDATVSTPIVVKDGIGDDDAGTNTSDERIESIVLPGPLMDRVHRALERGLKATSTSLCLRVIALCCPRNDDSIAVDAAVRRSAHTLRLDVLILDAERLADEEHRIFTLDLDTALYELYSIKDFDASVPAHKEALNRAVTHLRDFISTRSSEARPSRARVLYLRNFAAMSYVLRPLLNALSAAIGGCEMPVLVVAGIWPVTQLREPSVDTEPTDYDADEVSGHPAGMFQMPHPMFMPNLTFVCKRASARQPEGARDDFMAAFRTPSALRFYVESHFVPRAFSLRTPHDSASLADVFQAGMMQHYGVQRFSEASDDGSDDDSASNAPSALFEYTEVLPVIADHRLPIPGHAIAKVATQVARWNLRRLASARRDLGIHTRPCLVRASEWETPTGGSATVRNLGREMSLTDLDTLASNVQISLPSATPTYAELLACIRHLDAGMDALQSHISRIRGDDTRTNKLADAAIAKLVRIGRLEKGDIQLLRTLVIDPATFSTRYSDVVVSPAVMEAVQSGIASTTNPSNPGGILDAESPGGILLFGPPGTGKTMLCRAIAKECGVRFMHVRPSDIHSHYSGISEKTMRCIFDLARSLEGCIVFFDEIDSLFARRGGGGSSEKFFRSILSEFLQEMDGLATASANKSANVIVIGATNRPHDVDDAALRRFSQRILVDLPNKALREQIIRGYLKGVEMAASVSMESVVKRTEHYSGSDLKHLVRLAVQLAARDAGAQQQQQQPAPPNPSPPSSAASTPTAVSVPPTPPAEATPGSTPSASVPAPAVQLEARHFDAALARVKASCLTNMHALRRVQQFERRHAARPVSVSITIPLGFLRRLF